MPICSNIATQERICNLTVNVGGVPYQVVESVGDVSLDSRFRRNDGIVYQFIHASVILSSLVDLNRLLEEQTDLGRQAVHAYKPGFGAEIAMQFDPAVGEVAAVPEDLARMTVNLVMNACQAIAGRRRGSGNNYRPQLTVVPEITERAVSISSGDLGGLGDGKVVFQNAVERLDPGLFLLIQRYIPHRDDIFAEQLAGDRIVDHQQKTSAR